MTATGGDIVITARDLTKRYGKAHVVDRINFDIAKGETFGCSDRTAPARPPSS
jgi:ABC-type transporter Mla maintaining outer membrane lipid asymmetry ATPase subunit MlaF